MNYQKQSQLAFDLANVVAQRATCPKLSVGAVVMSPEGFIVATGYNGAPAGLQHCTEVGCLRDSTGRCKRAVHAEMNCILQAARRGVSVANCTMFVTHQPCQECLVKLLNSGLLRVVYEVPYTWPEELQEGLAAMVEVADLVVIQRRA